ncbi:hypothetical protein [Streptomyces sp. NPDC031705]|uniref:hypothetical protein n=1 Tax=Streptomyces sp. NPDC031705 TaxID=3155729 RepID=UPI0033F361A3
MNDASDHFPAGLPADAGDVLDTYLQALASRCGRAEFEAVIAAVRDTCGMLSDGHPAVFAGPDGGSFPPNLQREYLALLAVLMTGRTDLKIIKVPSPDGQPGWAVVEPDIAEDPRAADAVRRRVAAAEADRIRAADTLTALFTPEP